MENVKKFIRPGFYITVGFFNLIWLLLNHVTAIAVNDMIKVKNGASSGIGFIFNSVGTDGALFKILAALSLVAVFLLSLALIGIGVIKLLQALGVDLPFMNGDIKKYFDLATALVLLVNLCACGSDFIFVNIFCLCNISIVYSTTMSMSAGVGCWLLSIWAAGAFFVGKFVINKLPEDEVYTAGAKYVCSQCGKKAKSGEKFCTACGGAITEVVAEEATAETNENA